MPSIQDWTISPGDNATSDAGAPFPEGQQAKTINNGTRGMMGRIAEWRTDLSGGLVSGGSASVMTLTAARAITAYADGFRQTFRSGTTNTGATTLNINAIGAKPIKYFDAASGESDLKAGQIRQGGVYDVVYSASANGAIGAWVLLTVGGGSSYAVYKHTVPYNDFASMATNTWFTYPISSEAYDPGGVGALSSNVITPARDGRLEWRVSCSANAGDADSTAFLSRLIKNSDNTQIEVGSVDGVGSGAGTQRRGLSSYGEAAVTAGVGVRLQCHVATTGGTAQYNGWSSLPLPSVIVSFTPLIITLRAA